MKIEIDVEQFARDIKAGKSIGGADTIIEGEVFLHWGSYFFKNPQYAFVFYISSCSAIALKPSTSGRYFIELSNESIRMDVELYMM